MGTPLRAIVFLWLLYAQNVLTKRILCFVLPMHSHQLAQIPIVRELQQRGHEVAVATFDGEWNHKDIPFESLGPNLLPPPLIKSMFQVTQTNDRFENVQFIFNLFGILAPLYNRSLAVLDAYRPDFLLVDFFLISVIEAAQTRHVPLAITGGAGNIGLFSDQLFYMSSPWRTHQLQDMNSFWTRFSDNVIDTILLLRHAVPSFLEFRKTRAGLGLPLVDVTSFHRLHPHLVNTFVGLEYGIPIPPHLILIGLTDPGTTQHTLTPADEGVISFLESVPRSDTIILISMGSILPFTLAQLRVLLQVTERAPHLRFVVASRELAQQVQQDVSLSQELQHNGHIFVTAWISQASILRHPRVSLFWGHGGANGIRDVLYAAKPMLLMPFFGDQPGNAVRLADAGAAEIIDRFSFSADHVLPKIEAILSRYDSAVATLHKLATLDRSTGGTKKAADTVEVFMEVGYDHLLPAAHKIGLDPARQRGLDIFLLILVVVLALLWLMYAIICGIWRAMCSCSGKRQHLRQNMKKQN